MIALRGKPGRYVGARGGACNCPGRRGPGDGWATSIADGATLMVQTLCVV